MQLYAFTKKNRDRICVNLDNMTYAQITKLTIHINFVGEAFLELSRERDLDFNAAEQLAEHLYSTLTGEES